MFESRNSSGDFETQFTVAEVSRLLEVPASTLRTWERRYGVGPSARTAGGHRRYVQADVDALRRMAEMVRKGIAPAEAATAVQADSAARSATRPALGTVGLDRVRERNLAGEIIAAARMNDFPETVASVRTAMGEGRMVFGYTHDVAPALDAVRGDVDGNEAGHMPAILIAAAVLELLEDNRRARPAPPGAPCVAILADSARELAAHVLACALGQRGMDARVLSAETVRGVPPIDRARVHIIESSPDALVLMQSRPSAELIRDLAGEGLPVVVQSPLAVGTDLVGVTHLRTLSAVADEVADILTGGEPTDA